jgi:hypothetical protein
VPRKPVAPVTRISSSLFIQKPASVREQLEGRLTLTFGYPSDEQTLAKL